MNDLVNASLELFGGLFVLLSVRKVYLDKTVAGVSWLHVLFFTVWGFWNLHYYPALDQMLSFYAGIFLVAVNTVWVIQLIYYSMRGKS